MNRWTRGRAVAAVAIAMLTIAWSGAAGAAVTHKTKKLSLSSVTYVSGSSDSTLTYIAQARGFYRSSSGDFFVNFLGAQEKWIEGKISAKSAANQNNPWYLILPDGRVFEWSGMGLSGTLVAGITPDVNLYKDPSLLFDAFQDPTVNSQTWDQQRHFFFDQSHGLARNLFENFFGADEKWFRGDTNQFGNPWYLLLPSGDLVEWNGKASATGNVLAHLGVNAWNDFERVVTDFVPPLSFAQKTNLQNLDQAQSLFRASRDNDFFLNFFGQQEKWLRGSNNQFGNPWYFLKSDGTLTAWNGTAAAAGTAIATGLPADVYLDPLVIADAFADGSLLDIGVKLNPFGSNSGGPGDQLF